MADAQPMVGGEIDTSASNRPVWVINHHTQSYEEEFRGSMRKVPPNGEKKLVMRYLEARKFLGRPKDVSFKNTRGQYVVPPKALEVVEMTEDEMANWYGRDKKTLKVEDKRRQKRASKFTCHLDGTEFGTKKALDDYMAQKYPNHVPASE